MHGIFPVICQATFRATNMVIIFRDFLTFDQLLLTPQEKRGLIISNKHGKYISCLSIFRTTSDLGSQEISQKISKISTKSQNFIELQPSLPCKMKILSVLVKTPEKQNLNFSRGAHALFHMKARVCPNILSMIVRY